MTKGGKEYLRRYILDHPELRALSSHHMPLPPPAADGLVVLVAVFIRHPIERIRSVYEFERRQGDRTLGARMAGQMNFQDYVEWRMKAEAPRVVRNYQMHYCTSTLSGPNLSETDRFEQSAEFLKRTPLVGVVDRYDESMVVFENALQRYFPQIDLSYRKQNVGNRTGMSVSERVEELEGELNRDIVEQIHQANDFDLKLYNYANELLDARLAQIADYKDRVVELRRRVDRLANVPMDRAKEFLLR